MFRKRGTVQDSGARESSESLRVGLSGGVDDGALW